jgi:glucose-6-phosphate dehydrogenase assembly protein OpcA
MADAVSDTSMLPERILKELLALWAGLGKQEDTESAAVLRACAMTLIVASDTADDIQSTGETLAMLMREYPSRAIVLRVGKDSPGGLDARVSAQCWTPSGRRQQICCELIEINSTSGTLVDVSPLLRGLIVPDLPVVLWCRAHRLFETPGFDELFPLAHTLIVDSSAFDDGVAALVRIARLHLTGHRVADLEWTRLTRWRETLSQIFEDPAQLERLASMRELAIGYRGARPPVAAWYLAAWFQRALGENLRFRFEREQGLPEGSIHRVELTGPGLSARLSRSNGAIQFQFDSLQCRSVLPGAGEYDLLREELSIAGPDRIRDEVLVSAVRLAEADPVPA